MAAGTNATFEPGDRVMLSARLLRNLGTENFGHGNTGASRYCKGRGSVIGFAPSVGFIVYVLWDEDEENGIARGINVANLVHVRDVAREADNAQHSPGKPFQASSSIGMSSPSNGTPTEAPRHFE